MGEDGEESYFLCMSGCVVERRRVRWAGVFEYG